MYNFMESTAPKHFFSFSLDVGFREILQEENLYVTSLKCQRSPRPNPPRGTQGREKERAGKAPIDRLIAELPSRSF